VATSTSQDALLRALNGERAEVRALVQALTPVIQARVARVLLRSGGVRRGGHLRQEVEDLTQGIFESLFADQGRTLRAWDELRGMSLIQYVGLVAEREAISILRSRKRSPYTESPTETEALEARTPNVAAHDGQILTRQLTQSLCTRLLETLTPLGRRVFELLFCEEQSTEVVCRELGLSHEALYAWRSRIRKTARALALEIGRDEEEWVAS